MGLGMALCLEYIPDTFLEWHDRRGLQNQQLKFEFTCVKLLDLIEYRI